MHTQQLIDACRGGDERAWRSLVHLHARLVYSIPARAGLAPHDCDDVFQSVFTALLAHLHHLRDAQSLPAWLIVTARRAVWRHQRLGAREAHAIVPHEHASTPPEHEVERLERQQIVEEGLQALGHRCEQLLRALFHRHPAPAYDEVARRLGMAPASVGPTRARCLAKLAHTLESMGLLDRIPTPSDARSTP